MNIVQLLLHIFFTSSIFGSEVYDSDAWKNLLHINNIENEIISPQWYFSEERTSKAEFFKFKEQLLLNAHVTMCEFPARYLYTKEVLGLNSLHNLDTCEDLKNFYESFNKKNISVVITSEYFNAPSSAFGHIMLAFHDSNEPELDAKVVHFSALTRPEDLLRYSVNGLSGNYSGYFFQEPFFKKYNEYSNIEQRFIFLHKLKLSKDQRDMLLYHLFELKKARFKYYFLARNCGYQIDKLLQIAFNKYDKSPLLYFIPNEVLKSKRKFLEDAIVLPPLSSRAQLAILKLNPDEQLNFKKIVSDEDSKIENIMSNNLKKALVLYNQYMFRKKKKILPSYNKIQTLTVKDLDKIDSNEIKVNSPLLKPSPQRVSLQYSDSINSNKNWLFLNYRPVLIDLNDFQNHNLHESSFNLLTTNLKYNNSILKLEKLDFIDLKLISITRKYFMEPSWFLRSGINRENNNEKKAFANTFGIGQSFDLSLIVSYFIGASLEHYEFKKFDQALISYLNAIFYFGEKYKFLYEGKLKFYKADSYYNHNLSFKRNFEKFNLFLGYSYSKQTNGYIGLDFYF